MHKRMKMQKTIILVLAAIISVIIMSVVFGRLQTVEVLIIEKDISLNKTLSDQKGSFKIEKISRNDYDKLGGQLVQSLTELENKHLQYKLKKGSPIPKSLLGDKMVAGEFAANMSKNFTIYKMVEGTAKLPYGVVKGDTINIALTTSITVSEEDESGKLKDREVLTTGMILRDVLVYEIDDVDVYVKVTEQENLILSNASEVGRFVLQLPGKKDESTCEEIEKELYEAVDLELERLIKEMEKAKKTEEEIEKVTGKEAREALFQEKRASINCLEDGQKGTVVDEDYILNLLLQNPISQIDVKDKELNGEDEENTEENTEENSEENSEENEDTINIWSN